MIDPSAAYPGQVDNDPTNYPLGRPRNESTPGAGDGFPLEARWVRDLMGFFQYLARSADVTPTNASDTAVSSQIAGAIRRLTRIQLAQFGVSASGVADGSLLTLAAPGSLANDVASFQLASNVITVTDENCFLLFMLDGVFTLNDNTNPAELSIELVEAVSGVIATFRAFRHSATTSHGIAIHGSPRIVGALARSGQWSLRNASGNNIGSTDARLVVARLSTYETDGTVTW